MSFDPAHFNSPAHQEADRIRDERDEAQERADRFAERGPARDWRSVLARYDRAHPAQED